MLNHKPTFKEYLKIEFQVLDYLCVGNIYKSLRHPWLGGMFEKSLNFLSLAIKIFPQPGVFWPLVMGIFHTLQVTASGNRLLYCIVCPSLFNTGGDFQLSSPTKRQTLASSHCCCSRFPRKTEKEGNADLIDAWVHAGWNLEPSLFQQCF